VSGPHGTKRQALALELRMHELLRVCHSFRRLHSAIPAGLPLRDRPELRAELEAVLEEISESRTMARLTASQAAGVGLYAGSGE
jgi:hypothetical protein